MALLTRVRALTEDKRFWFWLGTITVAALAVRIGFVFAARHPYVPHGDANVYHSIANFFADGRGFISPYFGDPVDDPFKTASNPPLYIFWLSIPSFFGLESALSHQLWSCVLGAGTVVLFGLLGREVVGPRTGLLAAGLAVIYPNVFYWDTVILSESMSMFTATLAGWLAYRYYRSPTFSRFVVLGLGCGLAALSRAELTLLIPFVLLPLALLTREIDLMARFKRLVAAGVAAALVVTPWIGFNMSRFENPVFLSNGLAVTLAATQCDPAYYGRIEGFWDFNCSGAIEPAKPDALGGLTPRERTRLLREVGTRESVEECDAPTRRAEWDAKDESERASVYYCVATDYLFDNFGRFAVVVGIRLLRGAGVYDPVAAVSFDQFPEGREKWIAWTGLIGFWILAALAIAGVVVLRRRKTMVFPLVALVAIAFMTIAISFATPRYRTTGEPAVVVLAAVALDAALTRWRPRQQAAT